MEGSNSQVPGIGLSNDGRRDIEMLPLHESQNNGLDDEDNTGSSKVKKILSVLYKFQFWGTMKYTQLPNSFRFIIACFRGMGQVVFANNPVSGLFILVGLCIESTFMAFTGILALASGSTSALFLGVDKTALFNGLYSLNPFLVGLAIGLFFEGRGARQ